MLANRAVGLRRDLLLDAIADFAGGDSCAVHGSEGVRERERRQGQAAVGISLARLRPRLIVSMISSNADFWRQAAEDSGGQAHGRAQRDHGVGLDLQQAQLCVAILSARVFEELVGRQSEFAVAKLDAQRQQVRVLPHRAVADDEAAIVGRNTAHLLKGLGGDDRSHEALEDLWGHQHEIGPCVDEEADPRRRFLVGGHTSVPGLQAASASAPTDMYAPFPPVGTRAKIGCFPISSKCWYTGFPPDDKCFQPMPKMPSHSRCGGSAASSTMMNDWFSSVSELILTLSRTA